MGLTLAECRLGEIEGLPKDVQRYWDVWAAALADNQGQPPMRNAIKMSDLRGLTTNIFVAERLPADDPAGGEFVFRMCGSGVEQMFGRPLTGKKLSTITTPKLGWMVQDYCNTIVSRPCGGFVRNILTTKTGYRIKSTGLSLPVAASDGDVRMIMCYNYTEGVGFSLGVERVDTRADTSELELATYIALE